MGCEGRPCNLARMGEFRGKHFDATGSSESNAKDRWEEKADYIAKG